MHQSAGAGILLCMEEVLSEIIEKEKESESIIREARQKAQEIQREADAEVNRMLSEAKEQAAAVYSERVSKAEKEARKRYENSLEGEGKMKQDFLETKADVLDRLVEEITEAVLSSHLDEG